jgi:hypothetical protein
VIVAARGLGTKRMDGDDYRVAAMQTWRKAEQKADPDLARDYRRLAGAYLALARFRDRIEQHWAETREAWKRETGQDR